MRTALADFIPLATIELPTCPPNVIIQALRTSARHFCITTEIWQKELAAIDVVASTAAYTLDPATTLEEEPEVRRIMWAKISGGCELPIEGYHLSFNDALVIPAFQLVFETAYIPTTSVTGGLTTKVVLVPDGETDSLSTTIVGQWGDGILAGALWQLLMFPGKPWSNTDRAAYWREILDASLNSAIRERVVGHRNGSLRATNPMGWL